MTNAAYNSAGNPAALVRYSHKHTSMIVLPK